jgi:biotin transport system substrate-specific component
LSNELSAPITTGAAGRSAAWVRSVGIVVASSLFLAICSHIALPLYFTPVPLTLQTFAVLLIGLLLSPRLAAGAVVAYLFEGALGLPVFAPVPALDGLAHLLGPTGGYLLAYPAAAAITAILWRRVGRGVTGAALSAAVGSSVILASGALWLNLFTHAGAQAVLASALLPFIPGDLLKIAAAALAASGLRRSRFLNT